MSLSIPFRTKRVIRGSQPACTYLNRTTPRLMCVLRSSSSENLVPRVRRLAQNTLPYLAWAELSMYDWLKPPEKSFRMMRCCARVSGEKKPRYWCWWVSRKEDGKKERERERERRRDGWISSASLIHSLIHLGRRTTLGNLDINLSSFLWKKKKGRGVFFTTLGRWWWNLRRRVNSTGRGGELFFFFFCVPIHIIAWLLEIPRLYLSECGGGEPRT